MLLDVLFLCRLVLLPPATAFRGSLFSVENVVSINIPTSLLMYGVIPRKGMKIRLQHLDIQVNAKWNNFIFPQRKNIHIFKMLEPVLHIRIKTSKDDWVLMGVKPHIYTLHAKFYIWRCLNKGSLSFCTKSLLMTVILLLFLPIYCHDFWKQKYLVKKKNPCKFNTWCLNEPEHNKTYKRKAQVSLHICAVWSESSMSEWRSFGCLATHRAPSLDWSDCVDVQPDLSPLGVQEIF